jgi:stabilization protein
MQVVPLFGAGTFHKSAVVTRQKRVNCYYENRKDQDKAKVVIYGTAGLVPQFTVSLAQGSVIKSLLGTQSSLYLVAQIPVAEQQFMSVSQYGTTLFSANLATDTGNVSMAYSPSQVLVVDSQYGYLYNPSANTFMPINPWQATGAQTCTFVSGFFVAEQPGSNQFWVSNFNDGSTWGPLAFAAASSNSGNIIAVDQLGGNLLPFMQQACEFWQNVGTTPQPFAPILSATNQYGLAAIYSRGHLDQSLIYLAQNPEGGVQFVEISNSYQADVISDADIDDILKDYTTVSDAVALVYQLGQHKFYQCTFPTMNQTLLFDTATRLWSVVQTGVAPGRHLANYSTYFQGKSIASDSFSNQLYSWSSTSYTDNGTTILREIVTRHVLSNFNRIRPSLLYIDMETGVGLQTGQGKNPTVTVEYSKDDGRTWSGLRFMQLGMVGQYLTRMILRRFGSARTATFRIRMTDPVKFVVTDGAMKLAQRQPAAKLG